MVTDPAWYPGREQALVKHDFLDRYLGQLFNKMAQGGRNLVYVDGFAGPWKNQSQRFEDTSFGIALEQLRGAKSQSRQPIAATAHLVERDPIAFENLKTVGERFPDIRVVPHNGEFFEKLPSILEAIPETDFCFFLIDPKGWKDVSFDNLAPVFRRQNSELVINLMYDFLNRFIDHPDSKIVEHLRNLAPGSAWQAALIDAAGAQPAEREAKIIGAYCASVKSAGDYSYVPSLRVRKPGAERTLYHLVYATRSRVGLDVFRECQIKALETEARSQETVKRATRTERTGQSEMIFESAANIVDPVARLLAKEPSYAAEAVMALLAEYPEGIRYDKLWPRVLEVFQVTKSQLGYEINSMRKDKKLRIPDWPSNRHRLPPDDIMIFP